MAVVSGMCRLMAYKEDKKTNPVSVLAVITQRLPNRGAIFFRHYHSVVVTSNTDRGSLSAMTRHSHSPPLKHALRIRHQSFHGINSYNAPCRSRFRLKCSPFHFFFGWKRHRRDNGEMERRGNWTTRFSILRTRDNSRDAETSRVRFS